MIVVGVDGSTESKEALRWALDEARLRRSSVRVIYAWLLPYRLAGLGLAPVPVARESLQQEAEEMLDAVIADVAGSSTDVDIERSAVPGTPPQVLIEAADGAELLVVGSRGHGGFAGLLLGSVSQQCAHHAPCPVVIVRP